MDQAVDDEQDDQNRFHDGRLSSNDHAAWRASRLERESCAAGQLLSLRGMTLDGFRPADKDALATLSSPEAERLFAIVDWASHKLRIAVDGIDRLPPGRALLVANHAFGWDILFAMSAIRQKTGRPVWALGEHAWWKVPVLRRIASAMGTVDGTQENADRLLSRDELVLVMPGGLREALKPKELRYRLLWGHRYGFVRAAVRNHAPIVPIASIGADELFDLVGNAFTRGSRWLRRTGIPIPLTSRLIPIPHLVHMKFVVGDPIPVPDRFEGASEDVLVRRLRREVEGALHELFEHELAGRAGIEA
jgi:1-acyl-sn-glycerol-3-phosphate acyltransferase